MVLHVPSKRRDFTRKFKLTLEPLEDRFAPAVITVTSGSDTGTNTLRAAIATANSNGQADTIQFADSVKVVTLVSDQLILSAPQLTTIVGNGVQVVRQTGAPAFRVFQVTTGTQASITGLTFSNGSVNNVAAGAGIFNSGTLTLNHTTVDSNASFGRGAGIYNNGGSLTINNSTISNNFGLYKDAFSDSNGAGIFNENGSVAITNSTISGNSGSHGGGGIFNNGISGVLQVFNSTITNNRADSEALTPGTGGGLFCNGIEVLRNTIIADNFEGFPGGQNSTEQNIGGFPDAMTNCLLGLEASTIATDGVNGNILTDTPLLGPLADNGGRTKTHTLLQNSRAIAAGSQNFQQFVPYDQRDAFRDPGAPDIGAYEVQHPLSPVGTPSTYAATFQPKPSADANTAFVKGLYQSTLLRAPDSAGLAGWVAELNSGASRQNVTYGFINSVENRTAQVNFFYKYFLGRSPDPSGLQTWVGALQSGVDEGTVMSGFLLSPEFTGQNDNASFVNLMYYAILGRQSDPAGFADWKGKLDSGALTRDQVGNGFLRSNESITRVVVSDFGSYLKRTIDSAAAAPYVAQIGSGVTFGRVAANILGSDEFFVAAGQNLN